MWTVFKLEFCVSFLNGVMCSCPLLYLHDPLWTLTKKKSYCLMIVVATVEHHTSQSSAFQEIKALNYLYLFSVFLSQILKKFFQI